MAGQAHLSTCIQATCIQVTIFLSTLGVVSLERKKMKHCPMLRGSNSKPGVGACMALTNMRSDLRSNPSGLCMILYHVNLLVRILLCNYTNPLFRILEGNYINIILSIKIKLIIQFREFMGGSTLAQGKPPLINSGLIQFSAISLSVVPVSLFGDNKVPSRTISRRKSYPIYVPLWHL